MSPLPGSNIIKQLPPSSMNDTKSTSIDRSLHRNMTLECDRLATFKNGWPLKFLSDKQMAAAGFYFLCKKEDGRICDDVKCIYCGIELGKWVEGDDPLQDHEKWSPNCWFLRRMKKGTEDVGKYFLKVCAFSLLSLPKNYLKRIYLSSQKNIL